MHNSHSGNMPSESSSPINLRKVGSGGTRCRLDSPSTTSGSQGDAEIRNCGPVGLHKALHLVPVANIPVCLQYEIGELEGAIGHPYATQEVADKLLSVHKFLQKRTGGRYSLMLWDAYRTKLTQQAIFDGYVNAILSRDTSISRNDAVLKASEFVSDPDSVFPHSTGGAVDVTLLKDGLPAWMGTGFDDFSPKSAPDWYDRNPPTSHLEAEAAKNRRLLQLAMGREGFVGIPSEWWHFEWGTLTWAKATGNFPSYNRTADIPTIESPASDSRWAPRRQPVLETGAAQVFQSAGERAHALAGTMPGNYYARNSQPTTEFLNRAIASTLQANCVDTVESGLAACRVALRALLPTKGVLLFDHKVYYETQAIIQDLAETYDWRMIGVDLTDKEVVRRIAEKGFGHIDVVFLDNPRNWWLDTIHLEELAAATHLTPGATLICDVSLQPLQPALSQGVDVVVGSLSKYPSNGHTVGGFMATNDEQNMRLVKWTKHREGHVLAPEAAFTVLGQWGEIQDRLLRRSEKAREVVAMLEKHPAVRMTRTAVHERLGGMEGGQVSFHLYDATQGKRMEQVISQNSLSEKGWASSFALACTFGAGFSTFEHFASNARHREGNSKEVTGESLIPKDMVRLGIGNDPAESIIENLKFLLNVTALRPTEEK